MDSSPRFGPAAVDWTPVALSRNRRSESRFRNRLYDLAARMNGFSTDEAQELITILCETLRLRSPDPAGPESLC